MRGGGGNFGIVTSLEYRLHEVGPVLGGAVFYPAAKAKEVLHFWREFAAASLDELVTQGGSFNLPDGTPVFGIAACYCGLFSDGQKALKPLRTFDTPIADVLGHISYIQMQSMLEPFFPPGRQIYVKSNFLRSLSDEAINALVQYVDKSPSPYTLPLSSNTGTELPPASQLAIRFSSSAVFVELLRLVDVGEPVRLGKEQAMDARMLGSSAAVSGRKLV